MKGSAEGSGSRFSQEDLERLFGGPLLYLGLVLVAVAAIWGFVNGPVGDVSDMGQSIASSLTEYVSVTAGEVEGLSSLIGRLIMGLGMGFLVAVAYGVPWFLAHLGLSSLVTIGERDYGPLPERGEIEQDLLGQLQQSGISEEDSQLFIRIRRGFLAWRMKRVGKNWWRLNVRTSSGARCDLIELKLKEGDFQGRSFWDIETIYLFLPVINPATLAEAFPSWDELIPVLDQMARETTGILNIVGVWPTAPSVVLVGARAEFDGLWGSGVPSYSILQGKSLNESGPRKGLFVEPFPAYMKKHHDIRFVRIDDQQAAEKGILSVRAEQQAEIVDGRHAASSGETEVGHEVENGTAAEYCTQCGRENDRSAKFCIYCGQAMALLARKETL